MVVFHTKKVRAEIEGDLDITDITPADLQDDITAPIVIEKIENRLQK